MHAEMTQIVEQKRQIHPTESHLFKRNESNELANEWKQNPNISDRRVCALRFWHEHRTKEVTCEICVCSDDDLI